ncbi:aldehyde dehydrogenase (NAD+) [Granulicella aggregans]|uniref:aldehyde dehydrogenase (NAD(+)) n=1 Tax=Granulicella aggregans TaxID=474949 RepID=A0A7W7ZHN7_9BACT|nr:aldehyde dehydrogenase family protein [Granulicella aggregans]MBB5059976.1 aldehyde dehydrogenase (NAD+) [Granulicella aggregans]
MSALAETPQAATESTPLSSEVHALLSELGVPASAYTHGDLLARSPITGETLAHLPQISSVEATVAIGLAHAAAKEWRNVPAPRRGELIRILGEELRFALPALGRLVTIESGKLLSEGFGEVQEMVDICTFAAGLSRQLAGLTLPSERANHRMMETWHPLGVVGIISAFNFPVAVWSWNAALALVCGNSVVWKPSEKTPLTALATQAIFERAAAKFTVATGHTIPEGLSTLLIGGAPIGELLVDSPLIPLISATGSTRMGRAVGPKLAARFAKSILELGGNNAAIVAPSADLDLTLRAVAFSAMGTAGQRCTTLRRLIVHESVYDTLIPQLKRVYSSVVIGDPRTPGTLVGPLIDEAAFTAMQQALVAAKEDGAIITGGERVEITNQPEAFYVRPALVEIATQTNTVKHETFAPILYVLKYRDLDEAIALQNDVPQGLSSSIFTLNVREAELFLSARGSDCGIANVNIGTSGAEIGGAFGGEKETGGGRESGSDAWKQYMRRATNTINFGTDLPLAQGVSFYIG